MTQDPHNFASPPQTPPSLQPLNYASPRPKPPSAVPRVLKGATAWVFFAALAIMLFMLLRNQGRAFTVIPYSDFNARLQTTTGSAATPDHIEWMRVEGDTIYGKFVKAEDIPEQPFPVTYFKVALPQGMGGQYLFFQSLVDRAGLAKVTVEPENNLIVNILLPLIPWLLIFLFIWFFVFRHVRQAAVQRQNQPQLIISGPGRWIPDPPPTPQAPPQQ